MRKPSICNVLIISGIICGCYAVAITLVRLAQTFAPSLIFPAIIVGASLVTVVALKFAKGDL